MHIRLPHALRLSRAAEAACFFSPVPLHFLLLPWISFRRGDPLFSDAGVYGKAIHQPHEFPAGQLPCLLGSARPLEVSVSKPYVNHDEPVPCPHEPLEPVTPCPAEEEERILLERVEVIFKPYHGRQAVYAAAEVGPACGDDDL